MRRIALLLAALLLPAALTACGSEDNDVASDPDPSAGATPTQSPSPTAAPTVGSYPDFEPQDYTYTLSIQCFCAGTGVPVQVTVAGGEVTGAVFTADDAGRGGAKAGDPADKLFWLTVNDIIEKANDTEAALVDVAWPEGQAYPSSVYVDGSGQVADDEIGYTLSGLQL